jgi:hypothetical protein
MPAEPTIQPLSIALNIYELCDERGNTLGTGTREVCEVLLYIITKANGTTRQDVAVPRVAVRSNVRAAIAI